MGLCQSQETSTRHNRGKKGKHHRHNIKKNHHKKRRDSPSRSASSDSRSSGSDSERGKKDNDEGQSPTEQAESPLGSAFANGRVVDQAAYLAQYPIISKQDQDILFYNARTCTSWADTTVPQELLRNAMKLALLAPSAYNCCPMRVVFVTKESAAYKDKLLQCAEGESHRLLQDAPVCAIVATDLMYTSMLPRLMPYVPNAQQMFEQYDDLNEMIRIRNSNLQAGYLILALRSLGLAVGATCDFDNEECDRLFLENTNWKSNFIITTGYPAPNIQYPPRAYRLPFDVAAKLL